MRNAKRSHSQQLHTLKSLLCSPGHSNMHNLVGLCARFFIPRKALVLYIVSEHTINQPNPRRLEISDSIHYLFACIRICLR